MKLATIGTSAICKTMLESLKDTAVIEEGKQIEPIILEACYSRSLENAQNFAKEHGFAKAYDSLQEMFSDPQVDAIYIASPNPLHYPQARMALEAGKHVILEKPFTSTLKQANELFELAEQKNLRIFEAITNFHTETLSKLKEQLPLIGPIRQAVFNFSQYSSRYDNYRLKKISNVFDPDMDGGALVDINVYNIHVAAALFGKPASILYLPNPGFNGVDTSGALILEYAGFNVVCIAAKDSSNDTPSWIQGEDGLITIEGSMGRLNNFTFSDNFRAAGHSHETWDFQAKHHHMAYEIHDFHKALEQVLANPQADIECDAEFQKDKAQTLQVMEILEEAKHQRDAKNFQTSERNAL